MIYCTLGNFSKPVVIIILSKSSIIIGNFCKGVKIFLFSSGIIFGQLLKTFGDFLLVTLTKVERCARQKDREREGEREKDLDR